jgi:hypothetical protein
LELHAPVVLISGKVVFITMNYDILMDAGLM